VAAAALRRVDPTATFECTAHERVHGAYAALEMSAAGFGGDELLASRLPHIEESSLRLFCITWNLGNTKPTESELEHLLPVDPLSVDLVVVGLQELSWTQDNFRTQLSELLVACDLGADASIGFFTSSEDPAQAMKQWLLTNLNTAEARHVVADEADFTEMIRRLADTAEVTQIAKEARREATSCGEGIDAMLLKHLNRRGMHFGIGFSRRFKDQRLTILKRTELAASCLESCALSKGGVTSKGAVAVRLQVGSTTLAFFTCHLSAHSQHTASRHADLAELFRGCAQQMGHGLDLFSSADHVFCMGDFNYRIDLSEQGFEQQDAFAEVLERIRLHDWPRLMSLDQLGAGDFKRVPFLNGFQEGDIAFAPTFKCAKESGLEYVTKRVPSYCDRILWRSLPGVRCMVEQQLYAAASQVSTSDHKPVQATFCIRRRPAAGSSSSAAPSGGDTACSIMMRDVKITGNPSPHLQLRVYGSPGGLLEDGLASGRVGLSSTRADVKREHVWAEGGTHAVPVLYPRVLDAVDLLHASLIIAVDAGLDDVLSTVHVSLAPSEGLQDAVHTGTTRYTLVVEQPIEHLCDTTGNVHGIFSCIIDVGFSLPTGCRSPVSRSKGQ